MATQAQIEEAWKSLIWQQDDQQILENASSKQEKKIAWAQAKMDAELTWDTAIDSVITTPQSQWSPYQIAVANLNPDLKSKNKKYQSAFNAKSILENERVNLWQAGELMMNAYRDAIDRTQAAAERQMAANSAQYAIQAWWAIAWNAGLATNPNSAAAARISAMNQANINNMQVRSNADQNLASIYNSLAQVPVNMASISSNNAQIDNNAAQIEANNNLANAQANYYNAQASAAWRTYSSSSSKWATSSTTEEKKEQAEGEIVDPETWDSYGFKTDADWTITSVTKNWKEVTTELEKGSVLSKIQELWQK